MSKIIEFKKPTQEKKKEGVSISNLEKIVGQNERKKKELEEERRKKNEEVKKDYGLEK